MICSVSVPPDVDPDTIELAWLNEDDIITDDNRVTIDTSTYYFNESTLFTTIQINLLFEDEPGDFICYVISNGSLIYKSIRLQSFTSELCGLCLNPF